MSNGVFRKDAMVFLALLGLLMVYLFQRTDYLGMLYESFRLEPPSETASFVANRTIRLVLNDLLCILIIQRLFREPVFSRLAWWVFMGELFLLLPLYLFLKLSAEGPSELSSPLYQPIHRMIVNPLLMITLMAGMYFQKNQSSDRHRDTPK